MRQREKCSGRRFNSGLVHQKRTTAPGTEGLKCQGFIVR